MQSHLPPAPPIARSFPSNSTILERGKLRTSVPACLYSPVFVPWLAEVPQPLPLPADGVDTPGGGAGPAEAEEPPGEEEPPPVEDTVREVTEEDITPVEDTVREVDWLEAGGETVEGPQLERGGEDEALSPQATAEKGEPGQEMTMKSDDLTRNIFL